MSLFSRFRAAAVRFVDRQELSFREVNEMGSAFVSGTIRYWVQVTPGVGAIDASGVPCDAVWVDTDAATVTGKQADNQGAAATATPALPSGRWVEFSFYTITAVSSGNVWAGWYRKPAAANGP